MGLGLRAPEDLEDCGVQGLRASGRSPEAPTSLVESPSNP